MMMDKVTFQNQSAGTALDDVIEGVYKELHEIARRAMNGSATDLTIQPTALVNEAYIRLSQHRYGWDDRRTFMIAASIAMRRALVDHIRTRLAARRDKRRRSVVDVETVTTDDRANTLLEVEEELRRLEQSDPESAGIFELVVYGGLSTDEVVYLTGLGPRTVQRRLRFARAWLAKALS